MFISEKTLDDLLRAVFSAILKRGIHVNSSKGSNTEISGVLLELRQPTARLSRTETKGTVYSCLGESLWYLAKTNRLDFIKYYIQNYTKFSDDDRTLYGAYGPRIFRMRGKVNQIDNVIQLLKEKRSTRQAIIQIFNAEDIIDKHKDIPCTCSIQFLIRRGKLHAITNMRSNDAFLGLPHDVFAFTFLQEIVARSVGARLGTYKHAVGSLHLYDKDREKAQQYLKEAWQATISMPSMPEENPWPHIAKLLSVEAQIRRNKTANLGKLALPDYWADLIRLLQIYAATGKKGVIQKLRSEMSTHTYNTYIDKRAKMSSPKKKAK